MRQFLKDQINRAKELYPNLEYVSNPDLTTTIKIPDFVLPGKWKNAGNALGVSPQIISIWITLSIDWPRRPPENLRFHGNLRMKNGSLPRWGFSYPLNIDGQQYLFCCIEIKDWDFKRENLWRYIKLIYHFLDQYETNKTMTAKF